MKKFTKMLALGMAAALVFGMTVSAAPSMGTGDVTVSDVVNEVIKDAGLQDKDGNTVENVEVKARELEEGDFNETFGKNEDEALEKAISTPAVSNEINNVFSKVFPNVPVERQHVTHGIIEIGLGEGSSIPEGGLFVPVWPEVKDAAYVVAHWNGGTWEVLETKVENGYVYALFKAGFSPVYISVLEVTGEEEPPKTDTPNPPASTPSTPSTPASPKTGETLPVAGILAVICLAGVAVCAKKARYNR